MSEQNTTSDRTASDQLPLTEKEHEKASAELQIRNLIEINRRHDAFGRDDVKLKFQLKAGTPPDRNEVDNRTFLELYDSPAGWIYHYDSLTHERVDITDKKPPHDIFVDDSDHLITHTIDEENADLEDAYAVTHCQDSENDLARKIINDIQEIHDD